MSCVMCGRGIHQLCISNDCKTCHTTVQDKVEESGDDDGSENWRKRPGRTSRSHSKREDSLRDQQSTGRKRAAVKFPLNRDSSCEWQRLLYAGGGTTPIVGCLNGKQQARHHGPDKNTLNNDEGNVHRICHSCHNRWHARNDAGYEWGGIYRPHDPQTQATDQEIWTAEQSWFGVKLKKVVD